MSAIASPAQKSLRQKVRRRQLSDQIGRIFLAFLLIMTTVTLIAVLFRGVVWLQTPFIGAFIEPPGIIMAENRSLFGNEWPLLEAGVETGDRVTAVNGQATGNTQELYRVLANDYPVGDEVTLTLVSADGAIRDVTIELIRLPALDVITNFIIPYLIGLVYLGLGLWVYRNRRERLMGRLFLTTTCFIAIISVTTFDLWTTHTFTRLWSGSYTFVGWSLAALGLFYPNDTKLVADHPERRWWLLVPVLTILIIGQIAITSSARESIVFGWRLMRIPAIAGIVIFIASMLVRAVFAPSPSIKEQSRMVLVAAAASAIPFFLSNFGLVTIPTQWNLIALLVFPVVMAYTILQYNVLDTGRLVSFAATYGIMGTTVIIGYALFVVGVNQILLALSLNAMSATNPIAVGLLTFLLVVIFDPIRRRLQNTIDALFFQSRSEYNNRLTTFRNALTDSSGLGEIVRLLKQQLREVLVPTHTYVFLRDALTGDFIAAGEGTRPETDIRFEQESGLVNALSKARDVIFLEFNKPLPAEMVEDHSRLAVLRTPVMAPLQGQEGLAGWVAVGYKRSGNAFGIEELRFIQALADQASLAVERAQVISDLQRRVRELDVLSQVSQAVNFTTGPDVLLELIYTQTSKLVDATNFYIVMYNDTTEMLEYAFFLEGDERYPEREGLGWPANQGLAGEVIRTGRPIRTNDYVRETSQRNINPLENKHYAWMGVPLNAGNRVLGAMVVASSTQGVIFTDEQLKVFWRIADQAATALDKARLFRETEERARQLASLNLVSQEMSSTLDLENLLLRILRSAVNILNAEAGTLFLVDESTGELVFKVVEGGGAEDLVGTRLPPSTGIVGRAADEQRPVISNNASTDNRVFRDIEESTMFKTESLLAVPMVIQDKSIGVLEVLNRKDGLQYTDEDAALLTTFASQAAVAIENARLYEATDAALTARVDELQNLQRIDRELNRTLNFERVINITLDWALRTTGCTVGAINMLTPEGDAVETIAFQGYTETYLQTYPQNIIPLDDAGITGRVLLNGKAEFVTEIATDSDYVQVSNNKSVAQITVPILRVNRPIGVLSVETHIPDLLQQSDFDFIQRLAEHAAVAIENARLVDEIEMANRSKTEFISIVTHELKTPMTSIKGYTDLLKGGNAGDISDLQAQFLGTIRNNVDRMARLVSDLADTARIETGDLRIDYSSVNVKNVYNEVVRGLDSQIEEKQQTLEIDIVDELPTIYADPTRMVQVATNLISNAHKYTPEGGIIKITARAEVEVDPKTGDKRRVIHHSVADTGIGMSEQELDQLFTKFFRTSRAKDMAQGTGLGLNITKSLIQAHGGAIWVESEVGKGTTFHYTIPVYSETAEAGEREN